MSKVQFIFSTRYLGENYRFKKAEKLEPTTSVYAYLRDNMISNEVLLNSIKAAKMTRDDLIKLGIYIIPEDNDALESINNQKAQFQDNYAKLIDQLISDGSVSEIESVKERIKNCPGEDFKKKLQSRFSFYCLEKESDVSAYAVPHLDWCATNEWTKALIEWSIQLEPGEDVELYLVMHDKDVPGFQDEPYKYLTAEQIFNILQGKENQAVELKGDSEKQCWYCGRAVNMMVFQHTDNDVVDLLNDTGTSLLAIKDKLMTGNRKAMKELFSFPLLPKNFKGFLESIQKNNISLKPNCSVDICNNLFVWPDNKPKKLKSNRDFYEYSDNNGALLTDLMHVRTTSNTSKAFKDFVGCLRKPMDDSENKDLKKMRFPVIIQVYKSFFDDWAKAMPMDKEKILGHRNKKAMEENLERAFSFFNNSSIWIRLVDINKKEEYEHALADFNYFDSIGLYDYESAWENLEYNLRIFSQNYLESALNGHGNYVTPMLYGNEAKYRDTILSDILNERDVYAPHNLVSTFKQKSRLDAFFDVAMRILVIDDKIADCEEFREKKKAHNNADKVEIKTYRCYCERYNKSCEQCKLRTLSQILEKAIPLDRYGINAGEFELHDFFHWEESGIETYVCPTFNIDYLNQSDLEIASIISNSFNHVQIVGVCDVRTALLLLSKFKFDMVFCDYLLDYKDGKAGSRDYANQFFEFLSQDYKKEIDKMQDDSKRKRLKLLYELRREVLENRGPLDKFWIMPITGYNQTFIQDLYRNQIDLIGHKWNISNGANPITTPWQFLFHLNKFIELQLKQCVYDMDHLLRFLHYSCRDFNEKFKEVDATSKKFFAFQAFMGSEYASFIRRYGNRLIIRRDASCKDDKDTDAQSVFATYVWNKFYANPEYRDEIELNRLIRNFLHQASTMHNDLEGKKQLEEDFGLLCHFINNNIKVRNVIEKENDLRNKLEIGLNELHGKMDILTCNLSIY